MSGDGMFKFVYSQGCTAVGNFGGESNCRMHSFSTLTKPSQLTAVFFSLKALTLPLFEMKVRQLRSRNSENIYKEVPVSQLLVLPAWAGLRLFSGSAKTKNKTPTGSNMR